MAAPIFKMEKRILWNKLLTFTALLLAMNTVVFFAVVRVWQRTGNVIPIFALAAVCCLFSVSIRRDIWIKIEPSPLPEMPSFEDEKLAALSSDDFNEQMLSAGLVQCDKCRAWRAPSPPDISDDCV